MLKSHYKKILIALLVLIALVAITFYWHYNQLHPNTEDAYVNTNIINLFAQVSGPVDKVYIQNDEYVKQGDPLFDILATPYQAAFDQAQAQHIEASNNAKRVAALVKLGYASQSNLDDAKAALATAESAEKQAALNLSFTHVTAPASGKIVNFNLRVGTSVFPQTGVVLFSIVEDSGWWVDANFKETQLSRIREGQKASIKLDLYPDHLFEGCVEHINAGSGAAFSLLPPENASGNWIKVTQRFPVKVVFKNSDPDYTLRVGASAKVTIDTVQKESCS